MNIMEEITTETVRNTWVFLIDLDKAFDTIDGSILIFKLHVVWEKEL